jgi:hypothetical protein
MIPIITKAPRYGYNYRTIARTRYGWRSIGAEAHCVMDDFGSLVVVGPWQT